MISDEQRKPDGGLGAWIETMEAMGSGGEDAELLCLLLELRRRRESEALRNQPVSQPYKLPDGFVAVPRELTAENGAKFALSAEFYVRHTITCHECAGEGCEDCGDKGQWEESIMIDWSTIKDIWRRGINHFSPPTDSTT
jgi:hypothetical protein